MHNHYHILGFPKEGTVSEITKAFRRLALTEHPEKGGGSR